MRLPSDQELGTPSGLRRAFQEIYETLQAGPVGRSGAVSPNPPERSRLNRKELEDARNKLGLTQLATAKNNFRAEVNPEPSVDNLSQGYAQGSFWVNLAATPIPTVWFCVLSSNETAAWSKLN